MKIQTKFVLAVLCLLLDTSQGCYYRKFSENHSYCKDPKQSCDLQPSEVTDEDKKLILRKHNECRQKIATGNERRAGGMPEASNMLEMVWDDELASIAQKWADQCEFKHDCQDCRRVDRFAVGENLYTVSSTGQAQTKNWEEMVDAFYDEVRDFHKSYIYTFKFGIHYGHFTQVVWATSWLVGCGIAVYKEGRATTSLYVCNYGPGGNIVNGEMYKEGEPCSSCPSGTCCSDSCSQYDVTSDYSGLCKVIDAENFSIDG